ncbi:dual specificity protein phosphatase 8 [Synchiropus splendidus]|uniref:dual specificity protein phosphatase 8 n=1 Tax=Synchiropus splendidus TaxID=270530 RepID=UPI00237EB9F1|nr:dual specificity protein phosphatase 8 [Synchiropus splendidus]
MVWSGERESERPKLSIILPRLYLGAESDVTQEQLASLGISYVLNVSRSSPRPSFLPNSKYLRIPIDDSLWADLLPWIPQAFSFIDAAMSSGASVLVHCAAGISRSPALAVAYIMYSLGLDLDQAYRFVKERRPSISPNFNFLGQLQHFQGTLSQKSLSGDLSLRQLETKLLPITDNQDPAHHHGDPVPYKAQQKVSDGNGNQEMSSSEKLWTDQQQGARKGPQTTVRPSSAAPSSLLEKRKTLSLSLTPLGTSPASSAGGQQTSGITKSIHKREPKPEAKPQRDSSSPCRPTEETARDYTAAGREAGLLSPLNFTLNKLLDWGERVLLGGVFLHPVKMGQPTLPYRC